MSGDAAPGTGGARRAGPASASAPAPASPLPTAADRTVCVVLHDVADATLAACDRTLGAVADVARAAGVAPLPLTLLAVPCFHGEPASPALEAWLGRRAAAGDEIALHGWSHRDDAPVRGAADHLRRRVYTRGEGEFWSLDEGEAARRIAAGAAWFARNGWPLHGFVAPAWLLGDGARAALAATPSPGRHDAPPAGSSAARTDDTAPPSPGRPRFEWTATLRQLTRLADGGVVDSQSVVYSTSAGWRRALSRAWNASVARAERGNPLLRIELHPRDADFPAVRRSWQRILERALRDRTPKTVATALGRRPTGPPATAG